MTEKKFKGYADKNYKTWHRSPQSWDNHHNNYEDLAQKRVNKSSDLNHQQPVMNFRFFFVISVSSWDWEMVWVLAGKFVIDETWIFKVYFWAYSFFESFGTSVFEKTDVLTAFLKTVVQF